MCHVTVHQNQLCASRKQNLLKHSLLVSLAWTWMLYLAGGEGCFIEDRKPFHLLHRLLRGVWIHSRKPVWVKLVHVAACLVFERSYSGWACKPGCSLQSISLMLPQHQTCYIKAVKACLCLLLSLLQEQLQGTKSFQIHTVCVTDIILFLWKQKVSLWIESRNVLFIYM